MSENDAERKQATPAKQETKDEAPKKAEPPVQEPKSSEPSEPELSVEGDGDHLVVSGSGLEPGEYELRERSATFIAALAVEADEKGEFSLTRPNALTGRLQYELFAVNADGIAEAVATAEWPAGA